MNLGASELFLVLLVVLLLFGGKRLPETSRQLGRGLSEMRRAYLEIKREVTNPNQITPPETKPVAPKLVPPHSQPRNDTPESPQAS